MIKQKQIQSSEMEEKKFPLVQASKKVARILK
jgi:hypothetical protein